MRPLPGPGDDGPTWPTAPDDGDARPDHGRSPDEPCRDEVAGDTVDDAVDPGCARVRVFAAWARGCSVPQLAALTVAAYRNARPSGHDLTDPLRSFDEALRAAVR